MTEEFTKDMENLRKKNQTETLEIKISLNQIKKYGEGHSSRLEQMEDRISGLEDKIDVKKRRRTLRETTQKLQKEYARTRNSIKRPNRPNLLIMGIEEEEVQDKGTYNIFNKIIAENFPNLEKELSIQV
jgi:esterase/lipase